MGSSLYLNCVVFEAIWNLFGLTTDIILNFPLFISDYQGSKFRLRIVNTHETGLLYEHKFSIYSIAQMLASNKFLSTVCKKNFSLFGFIGFGYVLHVLLMNRYVDIN